MGQTVYNTVKSARDRWDVSGGHLSQVDIDQVDVHLRRTFVSGE